MKKKGKFYLIRRDETLKFIRENITVCVAESTLSAKSLDKNTGPADCRPPDRKDKSRPYWTE